MAEKRRGLGRGLGALISGSPTAGDAEAERTEVPGSAPSLGISDATSDEAPSSEGKQPTTVNVPRETSTASSGTAVPRETGESQPKANTSQTSGESPLPKSATKASSARKSSAGTGERDNGKTSTARVNEQERKPRPVDMFFAPGRPESDLSDGHGDSVAKRPTTSSRNRRVAVPDVLAQVMQQKDDKEAQGKAAPEASAQEAESPGSNSANSAPSSEDVARETLVAVPGATFAEISVGDIQPNRKQPRNTFDEDDMAELVHSIREVGLLQPIVVRPSDEENNEPYELVMGERRWRAVQAAGLVTIPAIIRNTSDTDLLRDALLENLHRSQLNPLEEAAAYQQLLQEFDCTQDELSERIGRSRPQISNTIRLMKLPALVQRRVAAGVLSAGHARALLGLVDTAEMERLAQRIVSEGLSVRATEEIVAMNDGLRRPGREKTPRTAARHERLDYLANSLSDQLDTSVKITLGAKKGRVSIEFGSVDDLNRIMSVISPSSEK